MKKFKLLKKIFVPLGLAVSLSIFLLFNVLKPKNNLPSESVSVRQVSRELIAEGSIRSQNEAILHFLTAGKLVYLPFKEGDYIFAGQTIAQLDSLPLQKQLEIALNNLRASQDSFDQLALNQKSGVLEGQQRLSLDLTNKSGYSLYPETDIIYNAVKHLADQSNANLNNASINVELANYALNLAKIISPINGIITKEEVNTPGINVTPTTNFIVADPANLIFKANVFVGDIDFIKEGSKAKIKIDGLENKVFYGLVIKIYPQKIILPNGREIFPVDIASNDQDFKNLLRLGQNGTALIETNANKATLLVPRWLVISNNYVWVLENQKQVLKKITTGKIHQDKIEVMEGLNPSDRIISNPEAIAKNKYSLL